MSVPLIHVTRGDVVESIHRGDLVVVNGEGEVIYSLGNPQKVTYFRSAAKPIQAIHVITSGAAKNYNFTAKEIAVMCSSHYAEEWHIEIVQAILDKIGLNKHDILGGVSHSLNSSIAIQQAEAGIKVDERFNDCSGKQSGMLAVCMNNYFSISDYLNPIHPCQQSILANITTFCEVDKDSIQIGIDGCSAPVHAFPLINMAIGYRNLANPQKLSEELQNASNTIFASMISHPMMISGTGGFCTELIKHTNGKLIGKVGAEGVYCVGIKEKDIGIALKIESGSMAVIPPVIMRTLTDLGLLTEEETANLSRFIEMDNCNDVGTVVGKVEVAY